MFFWKERMPNPAFYPFLEYKIKKLTKLNLKFYFWQLFFDILGRILKVPEIFENENFAERGHAGLGPKLPLFLNWTPKNIPNQVFKNRKKLLIHSTLLIIGDWVWLTLHTAQGLSWRR